MHKNPQSTHDNSDATTIQIESTERFKYSERPWKFAWLLRYSEVAVRFPDKAQKRSGKVKVRISCYTAEASKTNWITNIDSTTLARPRPTKGGKWETEEYVHVLQRSPARIKVWNLAVVQNLLETEHRGIFSLLPRPGPRVVQQIRVHWTYLLSRYSVKQRELTSQSFPFLPKWNFFFLSRLRACNPNSAWKLCNFENKLCEGAFSDGFSTTFADFWKIWGLKYETWKWWHELKYGMKVEEFSDLFYAMWMFYEELSFYVNQKQGEIRNNSEFTPRASCSWSYSSVYQWFCEINLKSMR